MTRQRRNLRLKRYLFILALAVAAMPGFAEDTSPISVQGDSTVSTWTFDGVSLSTPPASVESTLKNHGYTNIKETHIVVNVGVGQTPLYTIQGTNQESYKTDYEAYAAMTQVQRADDMRKSQLAVVAGKQLGVNYLNKGISELAGTWYSFDDVDAVSAAIIDALGKPNRDSGSNPYRRSIKYFQNANDTKQPNAEFVLSRQSFVTNMVQDEVPLEYTEIRLTARWLAHDPRYR